MKMPKSVYVTAILAVLLLGIYVVCGFYETAPTEEVVYPDAGLSDSIFELQNMTYAPVAGLDETIALDGIPFEVGAVSGSEAVVGGAKVRTNNGYYFLYDVAQASESTEGIIKNSMTGVLSSSADALATEVVLLDSASGYLHGCNAAYGLYSVKTADGQQGWLCLYRLKVGETICETDKEIVLGCMSKAYGTQGLANVNGFARAMVSTLRMAKEK